MKANSTAHDVADPESAARRIEQEVGGSYFRHKNINLCGLVANWFRFLTGRILKQAKRGSKRVRVKRNYDNLSNTATNRSFSTNSTKE